MVKHYIIKKKFKWSILAAYPLSLILVIVLGLTSLVLAFIPVINSYIVSTLIMPEEDEGFKEFCTKTIEYEVHKK